MRTRAVAGGPLPRWLALAVLILAAFLLIVQTPSRQVEALGNSLLVPLQRWVSTTIRQGIGVIETVQLAHRLREQNSAYREEVERLQTAMVRLREVELENQELRNLLGLRQQSPGGDVIPVRVVARDPLPFAHVLVVDGGTDQGIREDLPVMTWRGLVGRVLDADRHAARVLLLTDAGSSISGRTQSPDTRATGVVRGRNDDWLLMQYLAHGENVRTGDLVITSGLGGVFPAGIPIGTIVQVRRREQELFQEALVEPAARLGQLERVYVLKPESAGP